MLLEFLNETIPKALLPLSVLLIGFVIITASMLLTKLFMRLITKFKRNGKD